MVQMTRPGRVDVALEGPLPGLLQTVPLAELQAMELALRNMEPPLDISTDCYSILALLKRGKKECLKQSRVGYHLWRRIGFALEDLGSWQVWEGGPRPEVDCCFRWVPAHLPQAAVTDGRITAIDFEGNRAAYEAAWRHQGEYLPSYWLQLNICPPIGCCWRHHPQLRRVFINSNFMICKPT